MTKYFDEFTKLKQKEMSKTLEDITYKYINPETHQPTKVPASPELIEIGSPFLYKSLSFTIS